MIYNLLYYGCHLPVSIKTKSLKEYAASSISLRVHVTITIPKHFIKAPTYTNSLSLHNISLSQKQWYVMWYRDKGSWYSLIIRLTVSSSIVKNRKVNKLRNTSSYFISKEIIKNEINLTLCIYLIMLQSHGVRQGHLFIKLPRNTHFTSHTWLPLC